MSNETFQDLIARNKRNSFLLIAVFMVFFIALGLLIGTVWGGEQFGVVVAVGAGIVAFFLTLASYYGGSGTILSMSHAQEITHDDDPELFNVVEEMAVAGGLPMPRVYIINEPAPNAFATGRDPKHAVVAITTGLREKLTRDELQGVIGHEMSHVRNYDIRYAMLMAVMVGVLVMLCDIFMRILWFGGGRRRSRDNREGGGGGLQIILLVVALVLAIVAPILAGIIQMAMSRQREYLADASSVGLTRNPMGLVHALAKISDDPNVLEEANRATAHLYIVNPLKKLEDSGSSVFDSHPPIKDRIARLLALTR